MVVRTFAVDVGTGPVPMVVDARSGPGGEDPAGTFLFNPGPSQTLWSITCLSVSGTRAVLAARLDADRSVLLGFVDGSPDTFAYPFASGPVDPGACSLSTPLNEPLPLLAGDVVVRDAPAVPTAKADCRGDGWRTFGAAFRNQGQCVAFVERGPRR